jgi:hypothetical protein
MFADEVIGLKFKEFDTINFDIKKNLVIVQIFPYPIL